MRRAFVGGRGAIHRAHGELTAGVRDHSIALALAFQIAVGFSMPDDERGFTLFQLHKSVGVTILLLTLVRLGWRLTHRPPAAAAPLPHYMKGLLPSTPPPSARAR